MLKALKRWLPVALWMAVIFYFSSLPIVRASHVDLLDFIIKKGAHFFEYAVLFLLLARALQDKEKLSLAFLIGFAYAFTDETHQLFTPGRGGSPRDVLLFDTLGLSLAWLFIHQQPKFLKWLKS